MINRLLSPASKFGVLAVFLGTFLLVGRRRHP